MSALYRQFRAEYRSRSFKTRTRFYGDPHAAQEALMRNPGVGHFVLLGLCSGDVFSGPPLEGRACWTAPRNGGEVRITAR